MKQALRIIVAVVLFFPCICCGADTGDTIKSIIETYKRGEYSKALELLNSLEYKDARVFYYMGMAAYRMGLTEKAKEYFITSAIKGPDSKWAKASIQNYTYINEQEIPQQGYDGDMTIGFKRNSNISLVPDSSNTTGTAGNLLDIGITLQAVSQGYDIGYSFFREYSYTDLPVYSNHTVLFKSPFANSSYTLEINYAGLAGDAFYYSGGISVEKGRFITTAVTYSYIDRQYQFLEGYGVNSVYSVDRGLWGVNVKTGIYNAKDYIENVTYEVYEGNLGSYAFRETVTTDREDVVSYSYIMAGIDIYREMEVSEKTVLQVTAGYSSRLYWPANELQDYEQTWLDNTSTGTWWYYDGKNWVNTGGSPPGWGDEESVRRLDSRVEAGAYLTFFESSVLSGEVFWEYRVNLSTMNENTFYDLEWTQSVGGVNIYYFF